MSKVIPQTTTELCRSYQTEIDHCLCLDFQARGGSYIDHIAGDRVCKHIWHLRCSAASQIKAAVIPAPSSKFAVPVMVPQAQKAHSLEDKVMEQELIIRGLRASYHQLIARIQESEQAQENLRQLRAKFVQQGEALEEALYRAELAERKLAAIKGVVA